MKKKKIKKRLKAAENKIECLTRITANNDYYVKQELCLIKNKIDSEVQDINDRITLTNERITKVENAPNYEKNIADLYQRTNVLELKHGQNEAGITNCKNAISKLNKEYQTYSSFLHDHTKKLVELELQIEEMLKVETGNDD